MNMLFMLRFSWNKITTCLIAGAGADVGPVPGARVVGVEIVELQATVALKRAVAMATREICKWNLRGR
jgi:hypothetical protein